MRRQVESTYGAPVAGMLVLTEDMARLGRGDIFYLRYPDHPISRDFEGIAAQIMA